MKKLLLTLLLLLSAAIAHTQTPTTYPQVSIFGIESDTLSLGDSLYIDFGCIPPGIPPYQDTCYFKLITYNAAGTQEILWIGDYHFFDSLPNVSALYGVTDTVRRMYVHVPSVFPLDSAFIFTRGGISWYNCYIVNPTATFELSLPKNVREKIYYSLSGQILSNPSGQVIERIIFTDRSEKRRLIFYNQR